MFSHRVIRAQRASTTDLAEGSSAFIPTAISSLHSAITWLRSGAWSPAASMRRLKHLVIAARYDGDEVGYAALHAARCCHGLPPPSSFASESHHAACAA